MTRFATAIEHFKQCVPIIDFSLSLTKIDEQVREICAFLNQPDSPQAKAIRSLSFSLSVSTSEENAKYDWFFPLSEALAKCQNLKQIRFFDCLNRVHVEKLAKLIQSLSKTLNVIDLSGNHFGEQKTWMVVFSALSACKELMAIRLENCGFDENNKEILEKYFSEAKKSHLNLREINLSENFLGSKAFHDVMKKMGDLTRLELLEFRNCVLDDDISLFFKKWLANFIEKSIQQAHFLLREVNFDENQFTRHGIDVLSLSVSDFLSAKMKYRGCQFADFAVKISKEKVIKIDKEQCVVMRISDHTVKPEAPEYSAMPPQKMEIGTREESEEEEEISLPPPYAAPLNPVSDMTSPKLPVFSGTPPLLSSLEATEEGVNSQLLSDPSSRSLIMTPGSTTMVRLDSQTDFQIPKSTETAKQSSHKEENKKMLLPPKMTSLPLKSGSFSGAMNPTVSASRRKVDVNLNNSFGSTADDISKHRASKKVTDLVSYPYAPSDMTSPLFSPSTQSPSPSIVLYAPLPPIPTKKEGSRPPPPRLSGASESESTEKEGNKKTSKLPLPKLKKSPSEELDKGRLSAALKHKSSQRLSERVEEEFRETEKKLGLPLPEDPGSVQYGSVETSITNYPIVSSTHNQPQSNLGLPPSSIFSPRPNPLDSTRHVEAQKSTVKGNRGVGLFGKKKPDDGDKNDKKEKKRFGWGKG